MKNSDKNQKRVESLKSVRERVNEACEWRHRIFDLSKKKNFWLKSLAQGVGNLSEMKQRMKKKATPFPTLT